MLPTTRLRVVSAVIGLLVSALLAACGSSAGGTSGSSTATSGPVAVLYAGSLVDLMEKQIGPGFKASSGYSVNGFSGGSSALAMQIKGKVRRGDVFISASPKVADTLLGAANDNWVSFYGTFATSGLVLGYNPNGKFAADLKSKPWYDVITESGFRIGTTDPATDPKGKLAAQAMSDTAAAKNLPALKSISSNSQNDFPEETLVGRLQSGQLDAGFFYASEAKAGNIATVPLTGVDLKASYTISILKGAPNEKGAEAFIAYLLGTDGRAAMAKDGFTLVSPAKLTGSGVPADLQTLFTS